MLFRYKLKTHKDMAMNSFHKYVSAIRKSKNFKPVYMPHPLPGLSGRMVAKRNDEWAAYVFTIVGIKELQEIMGDGLVITSDYNTREMYAYDMWL
jgi:hypothetical protein